MKIYKPQVIMVPVRHINKLSITLQSLPTYLVNILNALNPDQAIESCLGQISKRVGITFHPAGVLSLSKQVWCFSLCPAEHMGIREIILTLFKLGGQIMPTIQACPKKSLQSQLLFENVPSCLIPLTKVSMTGLTRCLYSVLTAKIQFDRLRCFFKCFFFLQKVNF